MSRKSKSYWINKCDQYFSEIIRMRAGKCEETNGTFRLNCAHIISRSYKATRWDFDNAICLQQDRHMFYTTHPVEWEKFIIKNLSRSKYEELQDRAIQYQSRSIEDYEQLAAKLQAIRDSWNGSKRSFALHPYTGFPDYHLNQSRSALADYTRKNS